MTRWLLWFWRFITHRWTRYVAAWIGVVGFAAYLQDVARHTFDDKPTVPAEKRRRDGNGGHASIDFAGQWILGRMLVLGHGPRLYDRNTQYRVAQDAYPRDREGLEPEAHDAEELLSTFMDAHLNAKGEPSFERELRTRATKQSMGVLLMAATPLEAVNIAAAAQEHHWKPERIEEAGGKHIGGPLYPPVQALVFAPLALDDEPQRAYFITQWIMLISAFVAGFGVSVVTQGRVWTPIATAFIFAFPGFTGAHQLGQNAPLSLAIVIWGYALMSRGWETGGGALWGLLAFKPVWGAAFFLVPLLTRRWRPSFAMIGVGALFALATLPFTGIEPWFDWLKVGDIANRTYNVDPNWVPLSRDLLGIPRRFMLDWNDKSIEYWHRDHWSAHVAGWALWIFVVETTIRLSLLYPKLVGRFTGPPAAFLLLGAWMSCFHFMYYDVLLAVLAFFVIFDIREILRPKLVAFSATAADPGLVDYFRPRFAESHPDLTGRKLGSVWVANSFLFYFAIVIVIVQHTFPFLDVDISVAVKRFSKRQTMSSEVTLHKQTSVAHVPFLGQIDVATQTVARDRSRTTHQTPHSVIATTTAGPPWDTYCLIGLWLWCGVRLVREGLHGESTRQASDPPLALE